MVATAIAQQQLIAVNTKSRCCGLNWEAMLTRWKLRGREWQREVLILIIIYYRWMTADRI